MKKSFIVLAALAMTACGQQPYPQQQAQRQCDPQREDCYGYGVGRDSHGDALVAGVVGAAAGYAARGYMDRNRDRDDDRSYRDRNYDRDYDRRDSYRDRPRTTVVKNYYNTPAPTTRSAPVSVTRTAPVTTSRPATRTMFGSARRK
ncbi:MAG: hypothetical protein DI537_45625 [Stutzerimonas stutzeri]|nr:MAG: hypothetical protein DI537_45625 [Stutzerimonas stutzeri]